MRRCLYHCIIIYNLSVRCEPCDRFNKEFESEQLCPCKVGDKQDDLSTFIL